MLELEAINAWQGPAQALFDVTLSVGEGELVVLEGLNGAGKSSLMLAAMGLLPQVSGAIRFQGVDLSQRRPHERARLGMGFVPEDRRLFTALTVRENLEIAARSPRTPTRRSPIALDEVLALFPALGRMLDRPAAQMSGGEQQMLAIARTLMTSPSMLLLDEPCEGIAPVLVSAIRDALLALRARGLAMLVAEQNRVLVGQADRVLTLVSGRLPS
jgi:branched-chain amino acid transport system ATP-binding protein